jgi:arsenate reductase
MSITLYGIPNCDTVKRARAWLTDHALATGSTTSRRPVCRKPGSTPGWPRPAGRRLLNRKGTAWRALPDALKAGVTDAASARAVMLQHASTIKRPVVDWGAGRVTVGFEPEAWAAARRS